MDRGSASSRADNVPSLPERPPLEIAEQGQVWVVRAYDRGSTDSAVFSTHDSQIDAVRATKTKMEEATHPCALRWDSPVSVGNLYWNPLFERIEVRYDELLEAWTIVPAQGTCAVADAETREAACKRAKQIQHDYDFKHLRAYNAPGSEFEERDHRFLRHDITSAGVRFDPSTLDRPSETDQAPGESDEAADDSDEDAYVSPASPGQLGASVPDVTKVEFVDTEGAIHRYATPWGDGTSAEILAVSRKYSDNHQVREAFDTWLSRWRAVDDKPAVATVYESGTDPVPWVAYQAGEYPLATVGADLPIESRISALDQLSTAIDAVATESAEPVCGVSPEWIHVHTTGTDDRVTTAQFGLVWAVQHAVGKFTPTPFTAPEQIDGHLTQSTAVYQMGAVAYYLLCESRPLSGEGDIAPAIRAGEIPPARPVESVSAGAGTVIDRSLKAAPAARYDSIEAFAHALRSVI
jgi:hypothetical protein